MKTDAIGNIKKIIERESKTTTYKFALLRGTIDVIRQNCESIEISNGRAYIQMGLLINKWIFYYYPLFANEKKIRQISGSQNDIKISFQNQLNDVIRVYGKGKNSVSILYRDIKRGSFKNEQVVKKLYSQLRDTIKNMPMKYLGKSVVNYDYPIYKYHTVKKLESRKSENTFVDGYGKFSIPIEYYDALVIVGSFISGQDSILSKWADFSYNKGAEKTKKSYIIDLLLQTPIQERDVKDSKRVFQEKLLENGITCVWSGEKVKTFAVDHILPFSIYMNNDLWNLLPASEKINGKKSDKIPSPKKINEAKERIIEYWRLLSNQKKLKDRFFREMKYGLFGGNNFPALWEDAAIEKLIHQAEVLINRHGYEEWGG
jgi:hypothetical protein